MGFTRKAELLTSSVGGKSWGRHCARVLQSTSNVTSPVPSKPPQMGSNSTLLPRKLAFTAPATRVEAPRGKRGPGKPRMSRMPVRLPRSSRQLPCLRAREGLRDSVPGLRGDLLTAEVKEASVFERGGGESTEAANPRCSSSNTKARRSAWQRPWKRSLHGVLNL